MLHLYPTNGLNPFTGYGKMELGIVEGLRQIGHPFQFYDAQEGDVALFIGHPEWAPQHETKGRRWIWTMSETNRVSQCWVDAINQHFERVFVPAPDLVKVYEDSGVMRPVKFLPLGVDWKAPAYVERDPDPETFTFLTYSLGDLRKAADLVVFAFNRLFKDKPYFRLVIKCRDNPEWLSGLRDPQIEVVVGQTSDAEWHQLLARSNAFIFPSRGEGFGLPPREAVLSGLPTVATEWLGMWDVKRWGYAVPVKEFRPATFDKYEANAEGACWAEPDQTLLDLHMWTIAADYRMALRKARMGSEYLRRYFTWREVAEQLTQEVA